MQYPNPINFAKIPVESNNILKYVKMGVQIFLNFDNRSCTFRPGELITGNITINTDSKIAATGLFISFHGEAHVHWTEQQTRRGITPVNPPSDHSSHHHHRHHHQTHPPTHIHNIHPHQPSIHNSHPHHHHHHHSETEHSTLSTPTTYVTTKEYRNQETYFNTIVSLPLASNVEAFPSGNSIELEAGYFQVVPFSFQLPLSIPSSCKLDHGEVRYFAEACLKVRHSLLVFSTESRKTFKKEFAIIGTLDLPLINDVLTPVHLQQQKSFSGGLLCCCSGGEDQEFCMDLRLAKTGFTPGEAVVFHLNFSNTTDVTIKDVKAYFDQTINFLTFGKEKSISKRLGTAAYNTEIAPGSNGSWNNQLRIPPDASLTDLGGCRIIHIRYKFTIKAKASMCKSMEIEVPITVGTVGSFPSQLEYQNQAAYNIPYS